MSKLVCATCGKPLRDGNCGRCNVPPSAPDPTEDVVVIPSEDQVDEVDQEEELDGNPSEDE